MTDAWYRDATRLRAAWRINATEDRERPTREALQFIDLALILTDDENLHRLRTVASQTLGDDNALLESSAYLADYIGGYLDNAATDGYTLTPGELAQVRQNVETIAEQPGDDLHVADPNRLATVLDAVNSLVEYLDEYPVGAASEP